MLTPPSNATLPRAWSPVAVLLFVLAGCAANPAIEESEALLASGRLDESVLRLESAMRESGNDRELRATYYRQRDLVSAQLVAQAETERLNGRLAEARALFERAQRIDPNSPRVRDGLIALDNEARVASGLAEARALIGKQNDAAERQLREVLRMAPSHAEARRLLDRLRAEAPPPRLPPTALTEALSKPITLDFRDVQIKAVFDLIARTTGLNFVFDKDVRADTRVTLFVRDTSVEEVVRLVLTTNQLERKLLNPNTLMIYPDTPVKKREYQELVTRSFFLANADVKQAQTLIRTLVKTRDIFIDEKLNLVMVKDTPDAVRLAERLIESLDMAEPEVMLDVEVLEVTRNRLLELGLRFPDQISYGRLTPDLSTTIVNEGVTQSNVTPGGKLAEGFVDLRNRTGLTSFVANPAVVLNLRSEAGSGNTLANPRIRVKNREKAKIHIGDKLPVFTTTSTANVGVSSSVSYLDVGLKLDVEPNVYLDNEVGIKVALEVSSVVREITGPANALAYQIGTRSAGTVLRLRDGETQVLAGLISDEERSAANRLPGLGDLPMVGRLFSSTRDNTGKTEIVLLITPRVVRNVTRPESADAAMPAGSESSVGTLPLQLKRTPPRNLSLSSSSGAPARPMPPAAAAVRPAPVEPSPTGEEAPANEGAGEGRELRDGPVGAQPRAAGQPGAGQAGSAQPAAPVQPGQGESAPGEGGAAPPPPAGETAAPAAAPSSITLTPVAPLPPATPPATSQ
ncbi:MAG: general secretion pathway protein GspD [Hydrogenophaga sp.]|nr:general secretion pathway protein GspD [Hydrogenophaga sp.]NIN26342.1 general secretion pathway protein GspD [Hydrogenophaga sp.]NIN31217.1 general secretion pathway protein GspD [Hydrogenophaga sp.]NIN55256.1 general secretion pathway protein GspD [Hydrogenophaga sp.]NIO53640.1 general secretion pathway protein GspD [Hydrogenophaga sp.]